MSKIRVYNAECVMQCSCRAGDLSPIQVGSAIQFMRNKEPPMWIMNVDFMGRPNFYMATENILSRLMLAQDPDETLELAEKHIIDIFAGIDLWDYASILESIQNCNDASAVRLITYAIALTKSEVKALESLLIISPGMDICDKKVPEIGTLIDGGSENG